MRNWWRLKRALEVPHVGGDRRIGPSNVAICPREEGLIGIEIRVRVRDWWMVLKGDWRRTWDRSQGRRSDLHESRARVLRLRRPGWSGRISSRIAGRAAGELLNDAAKVAFTDVVDMGLRRGRLIGRRRRQFLVVRLVERGFADGLSDLVDAEVMLLIAL